MISGGGRKLHYPEKNYRDLIQKYPRVRPEPRTLVELGYSKLYLGVNRKVNVCA